MGRVLIDQRTTNGITKRANYTYLPYVDGSVNTLQYPSGNTITFQTGGAERLLSVVDNGNSISYATGAHYTAHGALASLTNGSNGANPINYTAIYDSRLQPCWIYASTAVALPWSTTSCTASATTGNVLDLKYNFHLGAGDNGNVWAITNNLVPSRSQVFTYDALNRITTAGTLSTSGPNCWGESYGVDQWANLVMVSSRAGDAGQCKFETPFYYQMSVRNQIATVVQSGGSTPAPSFAYDGAANLTGTGMASYVYNAENQMTAATTSGWATSTGFVYDGDGNRVEKSSGKIYWYGAGGEVLDESDLSGNITNEYVYFGGKRIARRNSGTVYYNVGDHLGTSREIVQAGQTTPCYDADFYPYGGEITYTDTCDSAYKFTGKERDALAENGNLDDFGARYYASTMGRFMTPDWAAKPTTVPYAVFGDPQTLNLYAYVENAPVNRADADGHETQDTLDEQATREAGDTIGNVVEGAVKGLWNALASSANLVNAYVNAASNVTTGHDVVGYVPEANYSNTTQAVAGTIAPLAVTTQAMISEGGAAAEASTARTATSDSKAAVPESTPAGPSARPSAAQQSAINEMGDAHGCSTCGATSPGTKSGNWVGDHQPPTALNTNGGPQVYKPQCLQCSRQQGGQVAAAVNAAKKAACVSGATACK
jgi:RHS repeat-associated protein